MNSLNKNDILDNLFRQMTDEPLPDNFRNKLMERIQAETIRAEKRKERLSLISIIAASISLITLAIVVLYKCGIFTMEKVELSLQNSMMNIPKISFPSLPDCSFYIYIGTLTLILLAFDHYLHKKFGNHKQKSSPNEL